MTLEQDIEGMFKGIAKELKMKYERINLHHGNVVYNLYGNGKVENFTSIYDPRNGKVILVMKDRTPSLNLFHLADDNNIITFGPYTKADLKNKARKEIIVKITENSN